MSAKSFVDTSILLHAHDASSDKHELAKQLLTDLWHTRTGVISTQILQEFSVAIRRANPDLSVVQVALLVQNFSGWEVVTNNADSIIRALRIETRHKISFWDALIVEAAQAAGAEVLYSENLDDGQLYNSVRVVNPFQKQKALSQTSGR
jgi:predicted nucleic acid-binding protein